MKIIKQDGRRYVVRDGQLIEVEMTHEAKSKRRRRAPTGQRFAMLTEERLKLWRSSDSSSLQLGPFTATC